MTNITRSNFQAHPFHLVSPSPWPLFTSISLLTLTTSGVLCYAPELNQAICWNILYIFYEIIQSAVNLLSLNLLGIFRDHTLEFFLCNIPIINLHLSDKLKNHDNNKLAYYLAGLIEADGTIIVPKTERSPKGKLNYPSIQIIFDSHDMSLALIIQSTLGCGSLSKKKGANAYVLTFNSKESIILIVSLINGKMRTPKIKALYDLIDWLNLSQNSKQFKGEPINSSHNSFIKLPLSSVPLSSNPWLAGFIDGDGSFQVRATAPNVRNKYPIVECRFEICQSKTNHNGSSHYDFMSDIANFLDSSFKEVLVNSKNFQYRVRTVTLASNIKLENYLNEYPLFSSKYLNYKDWLKILEFKKIAAASVRSTKGTKYDSDFFDKVVNIKTSMNNKRTLFVWDHLQGFYKLKK
uniref:Cytochrome c oxidase subunit 3 n=1 Tax=Dactylella sp. TaxID=1814903 RepID=A0A482DTX7_9PEZI|nr:hypothetical protein [Dactylella sp.]